MKRIIKFRGKTLSEPIWIYGMPRFFKSGNAEIFDMCESFYVQPDTVTQYTGQLDKNETEIYEGDIVKHNYGGDNYFSIGFVRFDYGWAVDYNGYSHDMPQQYCDRLEVVGNIYDNKIEDFINKEN